MAQLHLNLCLFCIRRLKRPAIVGLESRVARMTPVQSIVPSEHKVVANIADLRMVRLPGLDVDSVKGPIVARTGLAAVHPGDTVPRGLTGEVGEVDVVPLKLAVVGLLSLLAESVNQTGISALVPSLVGADPLSVHGNRMEDVLHVHVLDSHVAAVTEATACEFSNPTLRSKSWPATHLRRWEACHLTRPPRI
jgi:hypothetical protein